MGREAACLLGMKHRESLVIRTKTFSFHQYCNHGNLDK